MRMGRARLATASSPDFRLGWHLRLIQIKGRDR